VLLARPMDLGFRPWDTFFNWRFAQAQAIVPPFEQLSLPWLAQRPLFIMPNLTCPHFEGHLTRPQVVSRLGSGHRNKSSSPNHDRRVHRDRSWNLHAVILMCHAQPNIRETTVTTHSAPSKPKPPPSLPRRASGPFPSVYLLVSADV